MEKDFLHIDDWTRDEILSSLDLAVEVKRKLKNREAYKPFKDHSLAMIFAKPSARTRVSFETGFYRLGGHAIYLNPADIDVGNREPAKDVARVLSGYNDLIMARLFDHAHILELARYATVPVINGLTDDTHPCQVMADIMTFTEHRGALDGKVVSWVGDGNNVATSWIQAAAHFNFEMRLACPGELVPDAAAVDWARAQGARVIIGNDPVAAVTGSHLVITDTWVSMGCTDTNRHTLLSSYQVNDALMAHADATALFMHCLPAHRNEEVTDSVMDGAQSVVWDEAENRLHVQKGILSWCLL